MRRRVVEAADMARNMRERFAARDVEYEEQVAFSWPSSLQNVGDSLAVAYGSDKWQDRGITGRRKIELYKHLAESRNSVYVRRGLLYSYPYVNDGGRKVWPTIGPMVSFAGMPMPAHYAIIGSFEEANLRLYTHGTSRDPQFGRGDEGVVAVTLSRAKLGASKIMWSSVGSRRDQPFLFVYDSSGVQMIVTGDKLDVERDGIVG